MHTIERDGESGLCDQYGTCQYVHSIELHFFEKVRISMNVFTFTRRTTLCRILTRYGFYFVYV